MVYDFDIFPYPFEDNTFDEIFSAHFLEHVTDLGKVMEELTRIGKN
jgi:ubiquinone/menaquinone biosynthesis C-methylase UbiE